MSDKSGAFSLMELTGLVAIIIIAAFLLVPLVASKTRSPARVQGAVDQAKILDLATAAEAIKVAATAHYAQFGSLAERNGVPLKVFGSYEPYDEILLAEGFLERPFTSSIGARARVRLVDVSRLSAKSKVDGSNGAYDLKGDGQNDVVGASYVVEIVIWGVTGDEARAVKLRLDGPDLTTNGASDHRGRVIYRRAVGGGASQLHIYITHR